MTGRRIMRQNLITGRAHTLGRYPHPEYWHVAMHLEGIADGLSVTNDVDMLPDAKIRATQMSSLVIAEWRTAAGELDKVDLAYFDLYRISTDEYRDRVDRDLGRILTTGDA